MLQKWGHINRHLDRSYVLLTGITRSSDQQAKGPSINDVGNFSGFFDTLLSHVGSFLVLSVGNFDQFLTTTLLTTADVVYGQPLSGVTVAAAATVRRTRNGTYTPTPSPPSPPPPPPPPRPLAFLPNYK